jgi:LPS-assembly protein
MIRLRGGLLGVATAALIALLLPVPGRAQFSALTTPGGGSISSNLPVTFTADQIEQDRNTGIITATGHVQAWQSGHVLTADKVVFDRNTNVAAASGHVVLEEPDGEVVFSDYAELTQGMREAVLKGMSARLAENGRLVANGARRTDGEVNELSHPVYSTCNLCAKDPTRPPLWQLRAYSGVQDVEHQRIEYQDAWMDIFGVPIFYFPYFWHADPSVKRESGLLSPILGTTTHLGEYFALPYYWVLDDQSDVTLTPELTTQAGQQLGVDYRRRFNDGALKITGALADDRGQFDGYVFSTGQFDLNDNWRYGFNVNRATSATYFTNYRISGGSDILGSSIYVEGFGEGSYTRLDSSIYQGLTAAYNQTELPVVLPRYQYDYAGQQDAIGGRFAIDTDAFNVTRDVGTDTRRGSVTMNYERPFTGQMGDLWKITAHVDAIGYEAKSLNAQPNYSTVDSADTARALPQVALDYRWPLIRDAGDWGSQLIEPIAQIIVAPSLGTSQDYKIPNEDSLALQFTDANLFGFNKFPGTDRLESGTRANVGLHGAWYLGTTTFDALIGQSYRVHKDDSFPVGSGLQGNASDVVGHVSYIPSSWLDVTARARVNNETFAPRFGDVIATGGPSYLRLSGGYVYEADNPFYQYVNSPGDNTPQVARNELSIGGNTQYGPYKLHASARRDLARNEMVAAAVGGSYEDECFIFDVEFYRRFTSLNGDNGDTTVLFQVTFKTVGQFGYSAF